MFDWVLNTPLVPELPKALSEKLQSSSSSKWDWNQIGVKLGTKHVIYQMLANFM